MRHHRWKFAALAAIMSAALAAPADAANGRLTVKADQPGIKISPTLYGLMTEEINHSYDGGLYGELIQNRAFKDDPANPVHWAVDLSGGAQGSIALDANQPIPNTALTISLRLEVTEPGTGRGVGATNDGYWGIPVKPKTTYRASFYAKADDHFKGPLTLTIESVDGTHVAAQAAAPSPGAAWKKYTVNLKTGGDAAAGSQYRFIVSAKGKGTIWLSQVSLFPPTFQRRTNGNRIDLMQLQAGLSPTFLRLPGGNYLEGNTIAERFDWKKTLGPIEQRPGHQGPWGYRSTDGLGLLEYLNWCEDLKSEPLLAVYAGYSLGGAYVKAGPDLQPFVQEALDEIEYVTGGADTKWGAERARNGHPKPFPLHYVEVGNEDWFDKSGSYDGRFTQFYDAIKAKYPKLQIIATTAVTSRTPDVVDDHFYSEAKDMENDVHHYDKRDRKGPKVFVGEWASHDEIAPWVDTSKNGPTPDLAAALGDAAWMTGMERNSDIILMSCYAPMFVNVNPGARQWAINLIGYDANTSFGSPSYYALAMFGANKGDVVLPVDLTPEDAPPTRAPLYAAASRDLKTGDVILKVVNVEAAPQTLDIDIQGATRIGASAESQVLTGQPKDANTIDNPTKVAVAHSVLSRVGLAFTHEFPAYSVTVLRLKTKE